MAVVRSAVPDFFVAGADLKLLGESSVEGFDGYLAHARSTIERLAGREYLTIAGIDGHALGGGLELALACSLRVAGPGAKLGVPEIKLGIIPGAGGTQRLARILPRGKALDLILTGRSVDAEEAYSLGIVERLAPEGQTGAEAALEFAHQLAEGPTEAYRSTIRAADAARDMSFDAVWRSSEKRSCACLARLTDVKGSPRFSRSGGLGLAGLPDGLERVRALPRGPHVTNMHPTAG